MKIRLVLIISAALLFLLLPPYSDAATDSICYTSCIERGIGGGQYCQQACSYDTNFNPYAPSYKPPADFLGPIRGFLQGRELRRQEEQEEEQTERWRELRRREQQQYDKELENKVEQTIKVINSASYETLKRMDDVLSQEDTSAPYTQRIYTLLKQRLKEKEAEREKAFEYFVVNIKPKVVAVHPDFDLIMKQTGYWEWAEKQSPAIKTAAMDSSDPDDIIRAISEYKKWFSKITGFKEPIIFQPTPENLPPDVLEKMKDAESKSPKAPQ